LFRRNIYCKRQLRNKEAKRLNLITKRVHMNRCNGREVKQLTLDRDFNVPDARPDALQIMKEQGYVSVITPSVTSYLCLPRLLRTFTLLPTCSATARRTLPTLALTIRYPSVLKTRYIAYAYEYTTSYCGCQFMVSSSSHTVLTILCSFKPFYS